MIFVVLLALIAPQNPVINVAAADPLLATPADAGTDITPPVPPFYSVAPTTPGKPGTVVKSEELTGGTPDVKNFRIIYHSTDNNGKDTLVSALITVPNKPPPAGGFPVVAYAHGTTGSNEHCGISLTPFEADTPSMSNYSRQILPLAQTGYAVASSDY